MKRSNEHPGPGGSGSGPEGDGAAGSERSQGRGSAGSAEHGRSLTGVVLCGGESRRMGRDKGLMVREGRPWALVMADKLLALGLSVVYSVNETQYEAYSRHIPAGQLIIDAGPWAGPVKGLLTVHRHLPQTDILLVACDMIDLDAGTLQQLLSAWRVSAADFIAFGDERLWQPFCCIYTSRGLRKFETPDSLQSMLRTGQTQGLPITDMAAFSNYNSL